MNEGLIAAITITKDDDVNTYLNCFNEYPPDVALVRNNFKDPKNLDEALQCLDAKEWQEALQYEINQLEKLRT